jgi:hypothetical protein
LEHKANIFGVALICVAFSSEALTLGRIRGAALVGQPLDMAVQVQLDPGEDASALCFDADVFHADTRQDPGRVRVVIEAMTPAHTANVRILSAAAIDEPVVTIYLRTGCGQKTTRRYVLLADLPTSVTAPSLAVPVVPLPAPGRFLPASPVIAGALLEPSNPAAVTAPAVRAPKPAVQPDGTNRRSSLKAAVASPKQTPSDGKNKTARPVARSRLKLDPLELLSDRVANLDAYMTFPPSEDALLNIQKMQALEADVKFLRALSVKSDASLVALNARLQQAESERFPGGWVYALIAMVLACLTAVALLWHRQRRASGGGDDWWSAAGGATPAAMPREPELGPSPGPLATQRAPDEVPAPKKTYPAPLSRLPLDSGPSSELGVSLMEMSESAFDDLMQSGAADSTNRKPALAAALVPVPARTPQTGSALSLNSEATLDIRQQAEFFVSLGQTDRAVRILSSQIGESDVPSPLVYLDLLGLYHSLSLKSDFQRLRKDFNLIFNGQVPEFALFEDAGKSLESYPDVLARITALWATPTLLDGLEACIFQDPNLARTPVFDLAAFRELLLLHDLALGLVNDGAPGTDAQTDFSVQETLPPPMLDLDLDLGLFESGIDGLALRPVAAAEVDIPLLMPGDHESEAAGAAAIESLDDDPMLSFDLPDPIGSAGPSDTKPRP